MIHLFSNSNFMLQSILSCIILLDYSSSHSFLCNPLSVYQSHHSSRTGPASASSPVPVSPVPIGAAAAASAGSAAVPSQLPEPLIPRPTSTLFAPHVKVKIKTNKFVFLVLLFKCYLLFVACSALSVPSNHTMRTHASWFSYK